MEERPIACDLGTLSAEERARRELRVRELRSRVAGVRKVDGGYEFEFDDSEAIAERLDDLVELERRCCGFIDFEIQRGENGLLLRVSGPDGAREFLTRTFGDGTRSTPM